MLISETIYTINVLSRLAFTCSKSTTETLEKDVKYVQNLQQKHQSDVTENAYFRNNLRD